MPENEILAGLAQIVNEITGIKTEQVVMGASFVDDLDIDSLSMVEVAVAAEERFGVRIPDETLAKLKTVGDAVTFIASSGVHA